MRIFQMKEATKFLLIESEATNESNPYSSRRRRHYFRCKRLIKSNNGLFVTGTFLSFLVAVTFVITHVGKAAMSQVDAFSADSISSPTTKCSKGKIKIDAPVILVIGSCGLDRLLTVSSYPAADAKIRTNSYNEVGGGNAANTASAIGELVDAKLFSSSRISPRLGQQIRVKLLSKVGDDVVGQHIIDELNASNVETSSPLFRRGGPGSTTSFTTVIVDEKEKTRTCIHTPGTCGELSLGDIQSLSQEDIDDVFRNVIHLHSDSRHTDVSLWIAKEAKKRGITVSCDCEKDRKTKALDELIEVCDILFTNSNHLGDYLKRLTCEREAATGRQPLSKPTITINEEKLSAQQQQLMEMYVSSLTPSIYFSRWQAQPAMGKEVVVTHGSMGALHYKQIELSKDSESSSVNSSQAHNTIDVKFEDKNLFHIRHSYNEGLEVSNFSYEVRQVGILKDAMVVDTTGAGDAFIGGFILMSNLAFEEGNDEVEMIGGKNQICLEMGSFVGGRKVGGPGARSALPKGRDIDLLVGSSAVEAKASLENQLGSFNNNTQG